MTEIGISQAITMGYVAAGFLTYDRDMGEREKPRSRNEESWDPTHFASEGSK